MTSLVAHVLLAAFVAERAEASPGTLALGLLEGSDAGSPPLPAALRQLGASVRHLSQELSLHTRSVDSLDGPCLGIAAGLVGVPIFLTGIAFCIVERSPWESKAAAPAATRAAAVSQSAGAPFTADFGSQRQSLADQVLQAAAGVDTSQEAAQATRNTLQAKPVKPAGRANLIPSVIGGHDESNHISPLSTALLVKNPSGVRVQLDGELSPGQEQRTINVLSIRDHSAVLRAHARETADFPVIRVETCAQSEAVAILDTRFSVGQQRFTSGKRRVAIHNINSESPGELGPPCAWVVPGSLGNFLVYYLPGDGEPSLVVSVKAGTSHIESLVDAQGQVVARSDDPRFLPDGTESAPLWVKYNTDMALVICIVLAVQKLGHARWHHKIAC